MRRILAPALLFLTAAAAIAQKSPDDTFLDAMYAVHGFTSVAMAPDGRHVAWAVRRGGVMVARTDGSDQRQIGTADADSPAWSPDGRTIAWLGGTAADRALFVAAVGDEKSRTRLTTDVRGYLAEPYWSPDGRSIAFLLIENAGRAAGPLMAMSRAVGLIEEHIAEQRIAIVDVATKKLRLVTPADMYVYHFDWSPDGKSIAAIAAPGSGDNNWWIAQLHVVDVATATMKPLYKPKLQIADPHWSPDGRSIALIEGLMSDEGVTGGELMLVGAADGSGRSLTPGVHASITSIAWRNNDELLAGEDIAGDAALVRILASSGASDPLWRGGETITARSAIGASVARDGTTSAVIRSSFGAPPEIWTGPIAGWKKITRLNEGVKVTWGEARSIHWSSDEFEVQGWLIAPAHLDAARKYPVVVWIHGGPAAAMTSHWIDERAALLSRKGYFVFFPNPRGSYGQGESFTRANVKDFGHGDLRDVLAGLDVIARQAPVDTTRAGIWGWSYGGFMTMWTVTQTQRFKAAVAGAGIANWVSYYGENDIDQWMIPYFGASAYDDPSAYEKSSPIQFIRNVKTPTLVLVGERDGECPAPQSFEFWHALKARGVETQLVVYPDEGHDIRRPEHKRDIARRLVGWFDSHLR